MSQIHTPTPPETPNTPKTPLSPTTSSTRRIEPKNEWSSAGREGKRRTYSSPTLASDDLSLSRQRESMMLDPAADGRSKAGVGDDPEDEGAHQSTLEPARNPGLTEWSDISKGDGLASEGSEQRQLQSQTIVTQQHRTRQRTNDPNVSLGSPPSSGQVTSVVPSIGLGRRSMKSERQQGPRRSIILGPSPESSPSYHHHHPSLPTPDTATSPVSPVSSLY